MGALMGCGKVGTWCGKGGTGLGDRVVATLDDGARAGRLVG